MFILNTINRMIDTLVCTTLGGSDTMQEYITDIPIIKTMNWGNRIIPPLPIPKRRFVYDETTKWKVMIKCIVQFMDFDDVVSLAKTSKFVGSCIPPAEFGRKAGEAVYGTEHFASEAMLISSSMKFRDTFQDTYWFDEAAWREQVEHVLAIKHKLALSDATTASAMEILARYTVLSDADFDRRLRDGPPSLKSPKLVADTALFIASKYRDVRPVSTSLFASSSKHAYTQEDLLVAEETMLRAIGNKFSLCETRFLSRLPDHAKARAKSDAPKCVLSGKTCKQMLSIVETSFWVYLQQTSGGMAIHSYMKAICFIAVTYTIYIVDAKTITSGGLVDSKSLALFLMLLHADALVEGSKAKGSRNTDSPIIAMALVSELFAALQEEIGHMGGTIEDEDLLTNSEIALKAALHRLWRQFFVRCFN